jgi:hypothetical protein
MDKTKVKKLDEKDYQEFIKEMLSGEEIDLSTLDKQE